MYTRNLVVLIVSLFVSMYSASSFGAMPEHITSALKQDNIIENRIKIRAPDIAENGSVVGVEIESVRLYDHTKYVKKVWIFNEFRDEPAAVFELAPGTKANELATRLRLRDSGNVYVIAQLNDGTTISGVKHVKVTIGGCGGGGSATASIGYSSPGVSLEATIDLASKASRQDSKGQRREFINLVEASATR